MKAKTFGLGIGGNTAATAECLKRAAFILRNAPGVSGLSFSSIFRTQPWDSGAGEWYLNGVATGFFQGSGGKLLRLTRGIESACGSPIDKEGMPRNLDVDVLFLEGEPSTMELILPHPRMHLRRFVLVPLAQVFTGPVPGNGLTPAELLARTADGSEVLSWGAPGFE